MHDFPYSYPQRAQGLIDLGLLWRRKFYLLLAVALSVGLGFGYLYITPPVWEAQARVIVQLEGSSLERVLPGREDRDFLANQVEIIRSPLTVLRAVELAPITLPPDAEIDEVSAVLSELRVNQMLRTDVLKVSYRSTIPDEAVRLIGAVVESYKEHLRESKRDSYAEALDLLATREKDLRSEIDTLQAEFEELRKGSPLVGQGNEAFSVHMTLLRQLGDQLAETKSHRIDLENKLRPILAAGDFDANGQVTDAELPASVIAQLVLLFRDEAGVGQDDMLSIEQELWQAEYKATQLSQTYGPNHPERRDLEDQVSYWKRIRAERVDSAISALRQTLEVLRSTEQNLGKIYDAELSKVKALDNYLIREELLLGNIRRLVETHDSVLAQLGDFQLASQELAGGRTTVRVQLLDGPKLLPQPVWPRKKQFLGLSAMIGLVVGMLLVVAVDRGRSGGTPAEQPDPDVLAGPPAPRQLPRVGGKHG